MSNLRLLFCMFPPPPSSSGNCLLVGSHGQMKEALSSLALYIAGYPLRPLDTSQPATFSNGLKALFRQAGLEGKPIAAVINVRY